MNKYYHKPAIFKVHDIQFDNKELRNKFPNLNAGKSYTGFSIFNNYNNKEVCSIIACSNDTPHLPNFMFYSDKTSSKAGVSYRIDVIDLENVENAVDILDTDDYELLARISSTSGLYELKSFFFDTELVYWFGFNAESARKQSDLIDQFTENISNEINEIEEIEEDELEDGIDIDDSESEVSIEKVTAKLDYLKDFNRRLYEGIISTIINA